MPDIAREETIAARRDYDDYADGVTLRTFTKMNKITMLRAARNSPALRDSHVKGTIKVGWIDTNLSKVRRM
jgi:hypothetical protein